MFRVKEDLIDNSFLGVEVGSQQVEVTDCPK
jgi:hypothetical protein